MVDNLLERFKPELKSKKDIGFDRKILCIVEGQIELKYLYHLFVSFGFNGRCNNFVEDKIKVSWGKQRVFVSGYCKFGGGSQKGSTVPRPAQEAFEFEKSNLELYSHIVVLFDSDKDKANEVEKYFEYELNQVSNGNFLLASKPCFESSLIDYCRCGKCREDIDSIEDKKYPCDKYKNSFSNLKCFDGVDSLIVNLNEDDIVYLKRNNSSLYELSEMVKNHEK